MREWDRWHRQLVRALGAVEQLSLNEVERARFFEVEYCLRLHERLLIDESCLSVWTLLTGYRMEGVHDTSLARRMCMIARHRVRYLRTAPSWKRWLTWYIHLPPDLRLYEVNLDTGQFQRRTMLGFLPERLDIYDKALEEPAQYRQRTENWAKAGDFTFTILGEIYSVRIPEALAALATSSAPNDPPSPKERERIDVRFEDLERAAEVLQQHEPRGNWLQRVQNLLLTLVEDDHLTPGARAFAIDELMHLVGMVGAGKSTLIHLLVYYLVVERQLHVTLVLNTVVESIQMAQTFRQMGIAAAPAMGLDRGTHRIKYGQANATSLMPEDVFQPIADEQPAFAWLTAPCALSGAMTDGGPIPSGYEPCSALFDGSGKRYSCPLRSTCPVHQAAQDLPQSQVWIVTPASFVRSRVSEGLTRADMRVLEAVYRTSDVLIIDEADRVQVQWDRMYAPMDDLAGDPEALLDWLLMTVAGQFTQHRRKQLRHARHKDLNLLTGEANRFSCVLLHMLFNFADLVEWIGQRPLTNSSIYAQLADELASPHAQGEPDGAVRTQLYEALMRYSSHPTDLEEGGELATLVNDVRHDEAGLRQPLEEWLQQKLPWPLSIYPEKEHLLRRLELGLWLTAMDKRVDELLRNWLWAAPEFGERRILDQRPPDEYVDVVPESPLGNLLGYQYVERSPGGEGLLKYIQCYGLGRWLLLHFHRLYEDLDGLRGPHVFLTSATSWAPGSPQFHLLPPPNAILSPPSEEREAINRSVFEFVPVPQKDGTYIRVSGTWGKDRATNLEKLVHYLTNPGAGGISRLEQELCYWQDRGTPRKILLVVGSYSEARLVTRAVQDVPGFRQRVVSMHPDEDESLDSSLIRRGEIEQLRYRNVDVLVAPLLAIQRGFNILDEAGGALLGSAFFLVRPYPVPDDLSQHVIGMNLWAVKLLSDYDNQLPTKFGSAGKEMVAELRRRAYAEWNRRLTAGRHGLEGLPEDLYYQLLWDQFVVVWQTIGRLVRRGREARVFFVDAAFHPRKRGRSMLRGWAELLGEYLEPQSTRPLIEQQLAETLYGPAYRALKALITRLEER